MPEYLRNTISALTVELCFRRGSCDGRQEKGYADVLQFVFGQIDRMPWFLAAGINLCTTIFSFVPVFSGGGLFHMQNQQERSRQVEAWKRSRLRICRNLMKFYSSLVVLALNSRPRADRNQVPS